MSNMPEKFDASETADPAEHADVQVTHDEPQSRFVVELDGERALAAYRRREGEVDFTHTEVPPAIEGRGVGSALAKAALDWAVAERLLIVPRCAFIAAYVKEHPEYQPHVVEEWR